MLRVILSATFLLVFGCCFTRAQVPPRLENCLPIPTFAQEIQVREDPQPPPRRVTFKSVKLKSSTPSPLSEQQVLSEMQSAPEIVNSADWAQDAVALIRGIFQHHGYFRATVDEPYVKTISDTTTEEVVKLTVEVDAGKQYRLDQIGFAHSTQFDDRQLRDFFAIAQGELVDTYKLGSGMEAMRKAYGERGFVNMTAVPSFSMDEAHNTIALSFDLDEGKQFRIGAFEILGLDPAVTEKLIENSGLTPGSILNMRSLETFCDSNKSAFPVGTVAEDVMERRLDEQAGIVNLKIDLRGCPPAPK